MTQREFVSNFIKVLSYEGDTFLTSGSIRKDYNNIIDTISQQGYWAGNRVRYYFDKDYKLVRLVPRTFGK